MTVEAPRRRTPRSGAQSGALLAVASVAAIGLNYIFLLAAARILGSDHYGALAALLGLLTVVLMPAGAVQLAVSREVSLRLAIDDEDGAEAFAWATFRLGLIATAPVVAIAIALAIPLNETLNIGSAGAVLLTSAALVTALVFPITMGVLQGYQRFHAVAAMYVLPFAVRLALLAVAAFAGFVLGGAVFAIMAAALVSAVVAVTLVHEPLKRGARVARPALGPFLRYLWPVLVGLIGITVLTTIDLLVVKARFASDAAGQYAAASAFARVAFFLPATILTVLFPRTAARQARGEDTEDILGRSLIVAAGFGALLALFYGMTGRGLVHVSFGADFAEGGKLLVLFTISMTLFSLANVLVGFHLSRDETRFAWIVAAAVPVQIAVLALVPNSVEGVILADIVVGTALLGAHELLVDTSVPALRAGWRHFTEVASGIGIRRVAVESLLVLLGATAVVCILFWPLVVALGSMVVGEGSDTSGAMASFWWMQHEGGYHLFGTTHHTLTGAPFGWDEGSGNHIQSLLPYYPAYLITKIVGPVAAYNSVLLTGYVLSGASMYLLVRYLGCARLVAAWAGMVYIVFPWHLARTQAASLIHLEFLPLVILALVAASRRPSWTRFSLVGLATLACWLTAGYLGAMAFVATAAYALTVPLTMGLRRGASVFAGLLASAAAATFAVAVLSIVSGFGRGAGLHRVAGDLSVYGLRPFELVIPATGNFLFGGRLDASLLSLLAWLVPNPTESTYVGALTIALALVWIVAAWRGTSIRPRGLRSVTAGLLAVLIAAFLMALPSPISVFGHGIAMPSRLLWEFIPAIRIPARWVVLIVTALVPLAALGLQLVCSKLEGRGSWKGLQTAPAAVVVAAMLISFLELAISPTKEHFRTDPLPPEYAALARTPRGIVAEYPLVTSNDYIIWQTIYQRPLLNNAGFGSPADAARRIVLDPSAPGAAAALAFLGVTAIVTHPKALDYVADVPDVPNADWGPGYALVARAPDGSSTWRVTARPAPVLVTLPSGFGESEPARGHAVGFPLTSPSGVGYLEFRAREPRVIRLTFDAEPPTGTSRVLRVADADSEVPFTLNGLTPISVLVEVPRGLSRLLLKTDPAATSTEDAIVISAVRPTAATGEPALQAESISPDLGF